MADANFLFGGLPSSAGSSFEKFAQCVAQRWIYYIATRGRCTSQHRSCSTASFVLNTTVFYDCVFSASVRITSSIDHAHALSSSARSILLLLCGARSSSLREAKVQKSPPEGDGTTRYILPKGDVTIKNLLPQGISSRRRWSYRNFSTRSDMKNGRRPNM